MHDRAARIPFRSENSGQERPACSAALEGLLRYAVGCLVVMLFAVSVHPAAASAGEKCDVLALNSHHHSLAWTDEIARVIVSTVQSSGMEVIEKSHFHEGSIVIDDPETFQKFSKTVVMVTLAGIAALGIVVLVLVFNISQRRRAERLLRGARDQLELKVAERTLELSTLNKQLSDANWRLIEANEELSGDMKIRQRIEAELRKSQSILNKIFEANPDHLVVIDRSLRILHSNWLGGFEYVPSESREHNPCCFETYNPGQGRPCNQCPALEVFETKKPVFREMYNARVGHLEIRAVPIFDDQGAVMMVAEHIRDISERKKIEEELLKAQKLESLGVLAGGIAHDFNNLLTGIMGNISLVKMYAGPESRSFARLEAAEKACERAADLTQQLITFSKGGAPVRKKSSIARIIRAAVGTALRDRRSGCELALPDKLWPVEVDEAQMRQVIGNLITNADQAMPEGGTVSIIGKNVTINESAGLPLVPGRYVRISIRDQGSGISPENLPRIFDPYFTTKEMGSGLGLSAVYSIVKNHQGHLAVESECNVGTVFHLFLPMMGCEDDAVMEGGESRTSARILVVDDEQMIRAAAREMLDYLGYDTDLCADGASAVTLYQQSLETGEPYAAVILDLTMPGSAGGEEVMGELLKIDSSVIGIVSSGYNNSSIVANYRDYGFSGVVAKPYSIGELQEVLRTVLDQKGGNPL